MPRKPAWVTGIRTHFSARSKFKCTVTFVTLLQPALLAASEAAYGSNRSQREVGAITRLAHTVSAIAAHPTPSVSHQHCVESRHWFGHPKRARANRTPLHGFASLELHESVRVELGFILRTNWQPTGRPRWPTLRWRARRRSRRLRSCCLHLGVVWPILRGNWPIVEHRLPSKAWSMPRVEASRGAGLGYQSSAS